MNRRRGPARGGARTSASHQRGVSIFNIIRSSPETTWTKASDRCNVVVSRISRFELPGAHLFCVWCLAATIVASPTGTTSAQKTNESTPVRAATDTALPSETQASTYDPVEIKKTDDLQLDAQGRRRAEALARFMHGLILEESGETAEALDEFQKVVDMEPSNWKLASRLASELVKRGDSPRAIDILKNTIEALPRDSRPLILLSNIYTRTLRKPELALKYAERALDLAPESFDPYATLFEIHTSLGNTERAKAALQRAANSRSTDAEFWLRLGTMRAAIELDPNHAAAPPQGTLESINKLFDKAITHANGNADVVGAAADYFVLSRQLARAIPLYEKAVELEPSRMDLLEKLGQSFKSAKRNEDAIRVFNRMAAINPQHPGVHQQLGALYYLTGQTELAVEAFERGVNNNPSDPEVLFQAAQLLIEIKQFDRATALLERVIKQAPELEFQVSLDLARTLSMAGRHEEALAAAERMMRKAEAERPELVSLELFYTIAGLAYRAENWQRAAELYRLAIKFDPDNAAPAYNDLGYMWLERDINIDEAGQLIGRAIELEPDNGAYLDSWGWFHYKKGNYQQALTHLLRAAELPPDDPAWDDATRKEAQNDFLSVIYDHVGDAYLKLGNTTQAIDYWRKAIAAKPDLEGIQAKIDKFVTPPPAQVAATQSLGPTLPTDAVTPVPASDAAQSPAPGPSPTPRDTPGSGPVAN